MKLLTTRCGAVLHGVMAALVISATSANVGWAVITTQGDVTPAPAGASVAGPLRVGNTAYGSLTIAPTTPPGAATPLTVTTSNMVVGETATGIGFVQLSGFGHNLTISSGTGDLIIGNEGAGSVSVSSTARVVVGDDLSLGVSSAASGDLFIDGFGTTVDINDTVIVAGTGNALIQVTAGGRIELDDSVLGQGAGADGRVTVSGNGSTLAQSNSITIGGAGRGELQVISQGTVTTTNAVVGESAAGTGVAVVSGAGSNWKIAGFLNLGVNGMATLNVLDGGQLTTTGALRMATAATSESHAVINGVNALLMAGTAAAPTSVTVGETGYATLDVRSGAHMNSASAVIADNVGSRGEVLVDGVGSTWRISGTLDVSDPGEAQLAITGGGQVTTSGVVRIGAAGRLLMSTGRLEAGGAGVTNNGTIQGTGRIAGNVVNAATGKIRLGVGNSMIMANALTNAGLVDLDGSELETLGALTNTADIDARNATLRTGGFNNNSGAQLAITEGTVDLYGAVNNNADAQIVVGGHAQAVFHDSLNNGGQFDVFPNANVLVLENLTFSPTSLLNMQFALQDGQSAGGTLESAGQAALAGALAVTLAPGFAPTAGDAFQVITAAGGIAGTFATTSLPTLAAGLAWDIDYNSDNVMLSVVPGLMADFDGDGDVDAMDLTKWKTGFGKVGTAVKIDGDANGDGNVDGADLLAWQRELGVVLATASSGGSAAAVPEPASLALLAGGLAMVAGLRRRQAA